MRAPHKNRFGQGESNTNTQSAEHTHTRTTELQASRDDNDDNDYDIFVIRFKDDHTLTHAFCSAGVRANEFSARL